ncbi:DUF6236 family protein [Pseudoalteromonas piscicida]|uniref:Uncharacterized protein n=1 Tax=Pseudoalteromonas piscicida TaxID=43662 RepID=A0ABM6NLR4_PSEO7|nr:DUF6236 family protein [Pseudoalteromonas piscicida]ATD09747.1 hypothetical protein PPIS_b0622 [Pseudoalteromonas piscicida]WPU31650.1 DUF6236 family protein [Pseudoalteromonas piscicida]
MERGVIAAPMSFKFHMVGFSVGSAITPEMIRYYLLYWDKLIVPDNNLVSFGIPDEQDLLGSGKLYRPRSQLVGSFHDQQIARAIIEEQCKIAEMFYKDSTTDWVLHQHNAEQIFLTEKTSSFKNTLRINLANALPVPTADVNINDILEFKERRSSELKALHEALDGIYVEILNSPDESLAGKMTVSNLSDSINNLDRVSKERFGFFNKFSVEPQYSLNFKDIINYSAGGGLMGLGAKVAPTIAAAGQTVDILTGYTVPVATLVGTAAGFLSGLKVDIKPTKSPIHEDNKHLSYLVKASEIGVVSL